MFRDKEILHQVLNVKAAVHHLDLAVKEIHCKVFQKYHPRYDHELNASCDKDSPKLDLMIEKMNEILGEVNELKGVVSMARAALVDKKELAEIVKEVKNIAKSVETSYQYRASVTKRLAKLDEIHQWMKEDPQE
jgi:energy-converting hydrogenase A subunit M